MNMLIIGNGFDLAHDRPTTYVDFLQFLEDILIAREYGGNKDQFETNLVVDCSVVKDYILSSFLTRRNPGSGYTTNTNPMIQEIYDCLDKNVWYEYFMLLYRDNETHGRGWIDFESEIREVIEFLDREIGDIYDELPKTLVSISAVLIKIASFCKRLDFSEYNRTHNKSSSYRNTYFDLVEKTYQDLQKLVRCLEIYLDDCVGKMPITCYSPDIKNLSADSVLSFNYTAIPTDIYPSLTNTHYIHGYAKTDRSMTENNMVLGVNEYWKTPDKNSHTNFNLYKKFVQRIIKETGINYKHALKCMREDYEYSVERHSIGDRGPKYNHVYIFGHSLDITDGDILQEVIRTPGNITTVFYRNKQQQANQIANLSKVLGQDELLERTLNTAPTIIFRRQKGMEPV